MTDPTPATAPADHGAAAATAVSTPVSRATPLWDRIPTRSGVAASLLLLVAIAFVLWQMYTPCTQPPFTRMESGREIAVPVPSAPAGLRGVWPRIRDADGVKELKAAGDGPTARGIVAEWRARCPGLAGPRRNLRWDFVLIALYVPLLVLLLGMTAARTSNVILRVVGNALIAAVALGGALDLLENVALWGMLGGSFGPRPAIASVASGVKNALLVAGGIYLLATWALLLVTGRSGDRRYPPPTPRPAQGDEAASALPTAHARLECAEGPAADLDAVRREELIYLTHHRPKPNSDRTEYERRLVGLALSGGGIRAATTALGVLQGLAELKILPFVDYLSTVSGGGYIGSCLSSLLSLNRARVDRKPSDPPSDEPHLFGTGPDDVPAFTTRWATFPFRSDRFTEGRRYDSENAQRATALLAHLRTHGNFLIARRGLLTRDAMRAIGNLVTGVAYSVFAIVLMLFVATTAYLAATSALVPGVDSTLGSAPDTTTVVNVRPTILPVTTTLQRRDTIPCDANAGCGIERLVVLEHAAPGDWLGRNLRQTWAPIAHAFGEESANTPRLRTTLLHATLAGVVAMLVALAIILLANGSGQLATSFVPVSGESDEEAFDRSILWLLALATLAIVVAMTTLARQPSMTGNDREGYPDRLVALWMPLLVLLSARLSSVLAFIALSFRRGGWTRRLRSMWGAYQSMTIYGMWGAAAFILIAPVAYAASAHPVGTSIASIAALVAARFFTPGVRGKGTRWRMPRSLQRALLGVAVTLVIVFGVITIAALVIRHADPGAERTWLLVGGAAVFALLGWVVNLNKLGPHYFYRDRLAETYLFSEMPDAERHLRTFRNSMEMPLHQLHGDWLPEPPASPDGPKRPARRNGAPYHLVSAAINLSGSRDLTRKDRKSGYWLFSKLYCGSVHTGFRPTAIYRGGETKLARAVAISGAAASSAMGFHTFFAQAFATVLFNVRLGYWLENPARASSATGSEGGVFWPSYLWREVTMATSEHSALVNLSDGGHTGDNVGIYPLLQRRCKIIIACDAEQDGALTFGSFTEALRHAYIDEGIGVDIDLSMIRPDPDTGRSRSHCAVGRIRYPDRPDQASFIIYLKSSLTGDEPEPVLNYKTACPDFPHESTLDQFFDDAQFESYRALGVHIAKATFAQWKDQHFDDANAFHTPIET